jgi:transposase
MERIRVLNDRRERLVATQTADINQLRALLTEVDPARAAATGRLRSSSRLRELTTVDYRGDTYRETVTATIRDIAHDCLERLEKIRAIARQLQSAMPAAGQALIDNIEGCGVIVAAQLMAQLAGAAPFTTDAKLAAWAGTAPLDASSGRHQRHRLNRGGNRQANRAIHTIVITQLQRRGDAYQYVQRRLSEGKTRNEAIRAAKRYATRRIWKTINQLT